MHPAMSNYSPLRITTAAISVVTMILAALAFSGPIHAVAPNTPDPVTVSASIDGVITVSWPAVTGADAYEATAYSAATAGTSLGTCTPTSSPTSCTITMSPTTSSYYVSVVAKTGTDPSAPSPRIQVPGAPTGLALTVASGSITANWDSVTGATSYTVTAYSTASGTTTQGSCLTSTTTCTITGLTNGTISHVAVRATVDSVNGPNSTRVSATPIAIPSAPLNVTSTGADGSILMSWSAPSTDGGSAITGYTAQAWSAASGGTVVKSCTPSPASGTSCTIEDLINGTTYYVTVYATNNNGNSASSTRTARAAGSLPSAPRSVTISRGDQNIAVEWSAPLSDGGSSITSYTAAARLDSTSSSAVIGSCTTTELTCTISGLTNSTVYYISVTATTIVGTGVASSRVTASALNQPTAPRGVAVQGGDGAATVTWSTPLSTGGSTITGYEAKAFRTLEDGEPVAVCQPASLRQLTCAISQLTNGTTYFIEVAARNKVLIGTPSSPRVSVIPAAPPEAPRNVTAVQEGPDVRVRWEVPVGNGGRPISSYTASAYKSPTDTQAIKTCRSSQPTCLISGLDGYVYIDVVATTAASNGSASAPRVRTFVTVASDSPRAVAITPSGKKSMKVSWLRPLDDDGISIDTYEVTVTPIGADQSFTCSVTDKTVPKDTDPWSYRYSCSISGIKPNESYEVRVSASNSVSKVTTAPITVKNRIGAPTWPRELSLLPGDNQLGLGALLPTSNGGSAPTTILFQAWTKEKGGKIAASCTYKLKATDSLATCLLNELQNFEPYWVSATASNSKGKSPATKRINIEPRPEVPTAPMDFRVQQKGENFIARWVAPVYDGGYPITRYIVRVTDTAAGSNVLTECRVKVTETSCELTGFSAGTQLWFSMVAVNTVGESKATDPIDRKFE